MSSQSSKSARIESLALGMLVTFLIAAAALFYWTVVRAPQLAARGDNPRVVEAELQIRRGRILDANGVVLAQSLVNGDQPVRDYPVNTIGPAVGYYSFRHGTAGVEQGYDDTLRGLDDASWQAMWRRALHQPEVGQDIRLTLDADWQREADALLGERTGAIVILSVPDAAVKVMVSHPGYDPNRLDAEFASLTQDAEAPLLNRVTQGQFQPGLALQPFVIAAALDQDFVEMDDKVEDADASIAMRNTLIRCREAPPEDASWATVLQMACPAPLVDLARDFGTDALSDVFGRFGFYSQPDFSLQTALATSQSIADVQDAILGQELLAVTPLQMARAWVSIANDGVLPSPFLVQQVQNTVGVWQPVESPDDGASAVSPAAASTILSSLRIHEGNVLEHSTTALSGPEDAATAWYLGFTPAQSPSYAIVVVTEAAADASAAQEIGRAVLQLAPGAN